MLNLITPYASDFGKPSVLIKQFPDTESYVFIPKIKSLKNTRVRLYHRLYPEEDKRIFELLLLLSRLKKETRHIEIFVPYLPYARQDKEHRVGEVVSADILCGLLKGFGVEKLITYDCHFLPKPGNFTRSGLKIENRSAGKLLLAHAKKFFKKEKFILISPDQGSSYFIENARGYALHKKRERTDGYHDKNIKSEVHLKDSEIDVKGKNICIMDDIIATGGTILKAIAHLKDRGAKKIIVGATHGVFCADKIIERILASSCDEIFVTNSILCEEKSIKTVKLPKS